MLPRVRQAHHKFWILLPRRIFGSIVKGRTRQNSLNWNHPENPRKIWDKWSHNYNMAQSPIQCLKNFMKYLSTKIS